MIAKFIKISAVKTSLLILCGIILCLPKTAFCVEDFIRYGTYVPGAGKKLAEAIKLGVFNPNPGSAKNFVNAIQTRFSIPWDQAEIAVRTMFPQISDADITAFKSSYNQGTPNVKTDPYYLAFASAYKINPTQSDFPPGIYRNTIGVSQGDIQDNLTSDLSLLFKNGNLLPTEVAIIAQEASKQNGMPNKESYFDKTMIVMDYVSKIKKGEISSKATNFSELYPDLYNQLKPEIDKKVMADRLVAQLALEYVANNGGYNGEWG
ncbi:MAG: hypothetical protein NTW04_00620, partial [Elusimicrobia bacterium]|nr:hypothetical protein [Elusimicrobiota bacterium]